MPRVNFDRGVAIRSHRSGVKVCMYIDTPGVFLDVNEDPVADQVAKEAGFPVEELKAEARKKDALERAKAQIEAEFSKRDEDVNRAAEASMIGPVEVRHVGKGRYALFSTGDGERITKGALSKEQAEGMLASVSGVHSETPET